MRVESPKPMKNGGWLHLSGDEKPKYLPPTKTPVLKADINFPFFHKFLESRTKNSQVRELAGNLGVDASALKFLGAAWDPEAKAWAYPMRDESGKVCGIRLRNNSGQKWSVAGSKQGLFIPQCDNPHQIIICEGVTDAAAALTLGFYAIGRPSCLGCEENVLKTILRLKVREVVLVSDNDDPGIRGMDKLQGQLPIRSVLWIPPTKDLRGFLLAGGTMEMLNSMIRDLVWTVPKSSPEPKRHACKSVPPD